MTQKLWKLFFFQPFILQRLPKLRHLVPNEIFCRRLKIKFQFRKYAFTRGLTNYYYLAFLSKSQRPVYWTFRSDLSGTTVWPNLHWSSWFWSHPRLQLGSSFCSTYRSLSSSMCFLNDSRLCIFTAFKIAFHFFSSKLPYIPCLPTSPPF